MDFLENVLESIVVFQVVTDILSLTLGAMTIFGPLKWSKGLITYVSILWGAVLGLVISMKLEFDLEVSIFAILTCAVALPILTYISPAINRFILVFIVSSKITFMITTVLVKNGSLGIGMMFIIPVVVGAVAGFIMMCTSDFALLPYIIASAFLASTSTAAIISKYINQFLYGVTQDLSYLLDPYDIAFALFGIELTDFWTLASLVVLMIFGCVRHISEVKEEGYSLDTPVIVFDK